jgi:HK97 family phage major capsid protein
VPAELRFLTEDAVFEGDGVGKPLGIMNSPCLITVTRDTDSKILAADIVAMWARRWSGVADYVWLISQEAEAQLPLMTIASSPSWPAYLPPGGMSSAPYGSLFGRPVIPTEYNAALNTTGDIMLASLSQYQAISKGGVKSAASIHVAFTTDETAFRFIYRIDGQPTWAAALTPLHGSATQSPFVVLGSATA